MSASTAKRGVTASDSPYLSASGCRDICRNITALLRLPLRSFAFSQADENSWFVCFNLVLALPMFSLVGCALWAYKHEGHPLRWPVLRERFRLGRMGVSSWIWTAGLAIFMFGGRCADLMALFVALVAIAVDREMTRQRKFRMAVLVAMFTGISWLVWLTRAFFITIPLHPVPQVLQQFLARLTGSDSFMDFPMRGHWWIAIYYAVVLLFGNIAGEELWWRGYLLPHQEVASGRIAWLYHGLFYLRRSMLSGRRCDWLSDTAEYFDRTGRRPANHTCRNRTRRIKPERDFPFFHGVTIAPHLNLRLASAVVSLGQAPT